jgi:hypothetical protein
MQSLCEARALDKGHNGDNTEDLRREVRDGEPVDV